MRRMKAPQRVDQFNLFHPTPATPRWTLLPLETRRKAIHLLARLLRQHHRRVTDGGVGPGVCDE
jgi:hypothetical protein